MKDMAREVHPIGGTVSCLRGGNPQLCGQVRGPPGLQGVCRGLRACAGVSGGGVKDGMWRMRVGRQCQCFGPPQATGRAYPGLTQ